MSRPPVPAPDALVARLRAAGCVFAEDEAAVLRSSAASAAELEAMVRRRVGGAPLEHVVGWAELLGQRVEVGPAVFVPRRRSELLAREAIALAAAAGSAPVVVELCCGAGAVGAVVARSVADVELHAADVDPVAVRFARRNLDGLGMVHEGDLYDALPATLVGRVDVLVANAPYVPAGEIDLLPAEARLHEPLVALDGGNDGLDLHRRIAADAARWLAPGGHLAIETSGHQAEGTMAAFVAGGLVPRLVTDADLESSVVTGHLRS